MNWALLWTTVFCSTLLDCCPTQQGISATNQGVQRKSFFSCLMKWGIRFSSRNARLIVCCVFENVPDEEKDGNVCVYVCKSSQQFYLIEMDGMGSPRPPLPIKRLSCSPSVHTLCCTGLKRACSLSCTHCDWQTKVVLGSDCWTGD